MTIGKKLATYRKLQGLTQGQLGEYLNLSAQAISKWENDLAEPDITALRALSELYHVSIDDMLNSDLPVTDPDPEPEPKEESKEAETAKEAEAAKEVIGYCKYCGIAVTAENLGTMEPVVSCENCRKRRELAIEKTKKQAEEARKQAIVREKRAYQEEQEAEEANREHNRFSVRKHMTLALSVAAAVTIPICITLIFCLPKWIVGTSVFSLLLFGLVFALFYDSGTSASVLWLLSRSVKWPGVIFTLDADGCLFYIGTKIMFGILSFLIGCVMLVLSIIVGMAIGVIDSVVIFIRIHRDLVNGTKGDYYY